MSAGKKIDTGGPQQLLALLSGRIINNQAWGRASMAFSLVLQYCKIMRLNVYST